MYFGRFYEFKERLKQLFKAIQATNPKHQIEAGAFIKLFEKEFDQELRERNSSHHRERFGDVAIEKVFLTLGMSEGEDGEGWRREHAAAYQKTAREWAERAKKRSRRVNDFADGVATVLPQVCPFLSTSEVVPKSSAQPRSKKK